MYLLFQTSTIFVSITTECKQSAIAYSIVTKLTKRKKSFLQEEERERERVHKLLLPVYMTRT
jgi:hypothetical protein